MSDEPVGEHVHEWHDTGFANLDDCECGATRVQGTETVFPPVSDVPVGDIARLRTLAQAALDGWHRAADDGSYFNGISWVNRADAEFIAEANPAAVEWLCNQLDEAQTAQQKYVDGIVHYRNLAISLGARPHDMRNRYDADLCEKWPDQSSDARGEGWWNEMPEVWDDLDETRRLGQALPPFTTHRVECQTNRFGRDDECDCGLTKALDAWKAHTAGEATP